MKGFGKMIVAGVVIFSIGLIAFLVILGLNDWSLDTDWETKTYECTQDNNTLKLDYSAGPVEVVFYSGDAIKVEYPEAKNYKTEVREHDGKLSVTSGKRYWYNMVIWQQWKIPKTTVYLPKDDVLALDLTLNAGTLKVESGGYSGVKLELNAGTVSLGRIECPELNAKINAGTLNVDGAVCEKITSHVNAGSSHIDGVVCGDIWAKVNAGSSSFDIDVKRAEYNISVDKNAGSCNVSGQTGSSDKKIRAEVNAGSLSFDFAD
ncbi:MAG: DUF4097 domain-containing protein [Clostridia bacterium]|nr:DUF4097 domain-containing protein [Clostridia bacterium]